MEKNTAGKWVVFAYGNPSHASAGLPITGDAANITANIRIDGGAANAVDDLNPTELEDGYYVFDITAAEANGDQLLIAPASATANVLVIGVPGSLYTRPANFNDMSITATTGRMDLDSIGGTAQTPNDVGGDVNTILLDTNILQTEWADGGRLDLILDIIAVDTTTDIPALIAALNDITAAAAADAVWDEAQLDHVAAGSTGLALGGIDTANTSLGIINGNVNDIETLLNTVDGKVDTIDNEIAVIDANVDTMVSGIITGTAATGTLSTTQATSSLTGYTADQLIGRLITFTSGVVDGEQTEITDYVEASGLLTYTAMTLAPGNGDSFKIT